MGLLELATLYRGQKKFKEAVDVLATARQKFEGPLQNDPARAGWVALLRYHHGLALQEFGKLAEARAAYDLVVKQSPGTPVAVQAALGYGQCLRLEGVQHIDEAKKKLATPNLPPPQQDEAKKLHDAGLKKLQEAAGYLESQAGEFKKKSTEKKELARMYYEAAWAWRGIAEFEIAAARAKLEQEQKKKLEEAIAKKLPPGKPLPPIVVPPIPLKAIALQPAEQKARASYQILVNEFGDLPLTNHAKLELAEMLSNREEWAPAIQLLTEALENDLPQELNDQIRLRLGMCKLFKGEPQEGLKQFQAVADSPKSALTAQGHYYAGECLMQLKDWEGAVKYLAKFRDHGPFQNLAGVSDRALLRLGHAYTQLKKWPESKQAHELVWQRFASSPWINEARYGAAWALQNQKQFDQAVSLYEQVSANTLEEIAAKAQLQIGLCRFEQKKFPEAAAALMVVPLSYDYPEWSAAALYEAHRVFLEMKNQPQAVLLLQRLVTDYPASTWAKLAQQELEKLKAPKANLKEAAP
jgi:tetratricopeptide (TPR) repeat protein